MSVRAKSSGIKSRRGDWPLTVTEEVALVAGGTLPTYYRWKVSRYLLPWRGSADLAKVEAAVRLAREHEMAMDVKYPDGPDSVHRSND